jgi:hypothetical protein
MTTQSIRGYRLLRHLVNSMGKKKEILPPHQKTIWFGERKKVIIFLIKRKEKIDFLNVTR